MLHKDLTGDDLHPPKAHTLNSHSNPTADISIAGHKITGLGTPTTNGDAIRKTDKITEAGLEDVVDKKHTQNTDQKLDEGGANEVAVADVKDAVSKKHTQNSDTHLGVVDQNINMGSKKLTSLASGVDAGDSVNKGQLDTKANADSVILKDGTVAFTGNQSMGSKKLTSLASGTDAGDAVNKSQLDGKANAGDVIKKDGTVAFTGDQSMGSHKLTNIGVPTTNGDAIRATAKITEVNLESAVDLKHTAGGETQGGDISGTVGSASVDKIKGKTVDDTDIGNDKVLVYKTEGEKYVFEEKGGGIENWIDAPGNLTYIHPGNFDVSGDLRETYYVGRCVRYKDTAGGDTWQYTIIYGNSYNEGENITNVYLADKGLDSGLNSVQIASFAVSQIGFSIAENFSVKSGITFFDRAGESGKIVNVVASCLVAPTGADAIFDVNYSTDLGTWTTLFTTQGNRPRIPQTCYITNVWFPDIVDFLGTWYFRCDCDQIGSTVAGADGLIVIYYIPKNRL